jgi:hypothetical protein
MTKNRVMTPKRRFAPHLVFRVLDAAAREQCTVPVKQYMHIRKTPTRNLATVII